MKRCFAMLLAALMLLPAIAFADALPYARQMYQNTYVHTLFIAPETYGRACISPYAVSSMASGRSPMAFVSFDAPDNSYASEFDDTSCAFINEQEKIQYSYQALRKNTFERFVEECEDRQYLIYDGSEGYAAYVKPDRNRGYAMLALPEISEDAKLYAAIYYGGFLASDTDARRAEVLTETVKQEIERIRSTLQVNTLKEYWSSGKFQGLKMPMLDHAPDMLVMNFSQLPMIREDGSAVQADAFLYKLRDNEMALYAQAGDMSLEVTCRLETISSALNRKEKQPEDVFSVTLQSGREMDVELYDFSESGKSSLSRCSYLLATDAGNSKNKNYYLNITLSASRMNWTEVAQVTALLEAIMGGIDMADYNADPYVSSQSAADDAAAASGWVCPACNTRNSGNFCSNCGAKRP